MIYRKARFDDIESIYGLVHIYAAQGEMLPRSRNTLYENLRDMIVAENDGTVVGVGALHIMWDRLAEVRMMAIAPDRMRQGIGAEIVGYLLAEGDALGIEKVFTLTYKPDFLSAVRNFHRRFGKSVLTAQSIRTVMKSLWLRYDGGAL